MMLQCSGQCFDSNGKWKDSAGKIYGQEWYAETSNPCYAAAHAGISIIIISLSNNFITNHNTKVYGYQRVVRHHMMIPLFKLFLSVLIMHQNLTPLVFQILIIMVLSMIHKTTVYQIHYLAEYFIYHHYIYTKGNTNTTTTYIIIMLMLILY